MSLPYAEDVPYWKTSSSSPDVWIARAKDIIASVGGEMVAEGFGQSSGKAAYLLTFGIDGQPFRIVQPVLPSRTGKERAARVQAATLLYHDVKARSINALVHGAKVAFFAYMMLPDGRVASELSAPELAEEFPRQIGTRQ